MKKVHRKTGKIKTVVPPHKWISDSLFQTIQETIPIACVDLIILRKNAGITETLLIKRKIYPTTEIGKWGLIGGRIIKGEWMKDSIRRQAQRELGISVRILSPWSDTMPVMTLSNPQSDPQKHFLVAVYPVTIVKGVPSMSGPEFSESKWFEITKLPKNMSFSHREELTSFIKAKLKYHIK